MASAQRSSFQKKGAPRNSLIKGTSPSIHNSQLLVSSGISSFDSLIGGGVPVGSLVLINEDEYGAYAKYFFKYFLAEGIASQHAIYVCSKDDNPEEIVQKLPSCVDSEPSIKDDEVEERKMTIAWRYENLKAASSHTSHSYFGHFFDLSNTIDEKAMIKSNITYWSETDVKEGESFHQSAYYSLLKSIRQKLEDGKYFASQTNPKRNILRIALHRLNSPLWRCDFPHGSPENSIYFLTFLYSLRALIRNAFATCFISLPHTKHKNEIVEKSIHLADVAVQLQSFAGTPCENVSPYKDYNGFFIIQKLAAINSLVAYNPKVTNLAFKLRRRKLVIEEFSLPPELEDSKEREQDELSVLSCSSAGSKKFDF